MRGVRTEGSPETGSRRRESVWSPYGVALHRLVVDSDDNVGVAVRMGAIKERDLEALNTTGIPRTDSLC